MTAYLVVNFGGPRNLGEIEPFLSALLTDRDVVRTKLPKTLHNILFRRIAKKRTGKVSESYKSIGGGSPIYGDTEYVADQLRSRLKGPVLTFHRYLPATHDETLRHLEALEVDEIVIFPMFPQFTYATTGSIARLFQDRLSKNTLQKMKWVKSYPSHPAFVEVTQRAIREYLVEQNLSEEEVLLFFSAHGVPQTFIDEGDLYAYECRLSYERVLAGFPRSRGLLAFQSKFGPGEWLKPYTQDVCERIESYAKGLERVLFIPISFTSDHIETLFEIEQEYVPIIREQGLYPYRLPALNRRDDWIEAIVAILKDFTPVSTEMLVRR